MDYIIHAAIRNMDSVSISWTDSGEIPTLSWDAIFVIYNYSYFIFVRMEYWLIAIGFD